MKDGFEKTADSLPEPHWKYIEKIVALLEKSLSTTAKVEHNIFLPVLGRPEREPRQCDVVITYGEEPRRFTAIVEVQERNRKPDINTFNGWVEKMREVGAQLLICVSVLGYPESIKNKVVYELGPTVRLLTLENLEDTKIPGLIFKPFIIHEQPNYTITSVGIVRLIGQPSKFKIDLNTGDKFFGLDEDATRLSLNDLITIFLNKDISEIFFHQGIFEPKSYSLELELGSNTRILWLYLDEIRYEVKNLPVTVQVNTKTTKIPLSVFSYRQETIEGVLAWVTTARETVDGKEISIQLVFKPNADGLLQLVKVQQQGSERLKLYTSPRKEDLRALDDF